MSAYFFVLQSGGWHWGESLEAYDSLYLQATTACFSAIIVTQIVNVFLCKTPGRSVFSGQLFDNRIILWGIALEITLVLVIVYTHWGNLIFGTAPIAPEVWLFMLPLCFGNAAAGRIAQGCGRKASLVFHHSQYNCNSKSDRLLGSEGIYINTSAWD